MYIDPTTNKMVFENSGTMRNYSAQETLEIIGKLRDGYAMHVSDNGEVSFTLSAEAEAKNKREAYEQKADSLIREKYTISQELSILRQRDEKPEEYAEYYAYCEQCKTTARAEIYGGETQ